VSVLRSWLCPRRVGNTFSYASSLISSVFLRVGDVMLATVTTHHRDGAHAVSDARERPRPIDPDTERGRADTLDSSSATPRLSSRPEPRTQTNRSAAIIDVDPDARGAALSEVAGILAGAARRQIAASPG